MHVIQERLRQQVMDFFAIPRDVRDIIWVENRVMLRAERARITTYYVKEVLRELSEREFPSKSREVAIEGEYHWYVSVLTKTIGFSEPEYDNVLEINGKSSEFYLFSNKTRDSYKLCGSKAYEAFISEDYNKYLINENSINPHWSYYEDDDNDNDNDDME